VAELGAKRQAVIAATERDERLRDEMREQSARQMRDRQLSDLHSASIQQQQFGNATLRSARFAAQRQLLDSALAHISPPPPPPEPNIVVAIKTTAARISARAISMLPSGVRNRSRGFDKLAATGRLHRNSARCADGLLIMGMRQMVESAPTARVDRFRLSSSWRD
jgi:hypothetical protein